MIFAFVIFTVVGLIIMVNEFLLYSVYGFFAKEEVLKKYFDEREGGFTLNPYKPSIIEFVNPYDGGFITDHTSVSIFSKYYIHGVGRVWRWSDSHKKIEELYEKLNLQ